MAASSSREARDTSQVPGCRHAGGSLISGDNNTTTTTTTTATATVINTSNEAASLPHVEFAVNFSTQADLLKLDEALKRRGVQMVASDLEDKTIQVEVGNSRAAAGALDVQSLQRYVEQETGFLAVVKGVGQLAAAVAELKPAAAASAAAANRAALFGVVRLSQMANGACFVDGLIEDTDGQQARALPAGRLSLAVHEFGDLSSDNYQSIGEPTLEILPRELATAQHEPQSSTISIQQIVTHCDVAQQIGKSVALSVISGDRADSTSREILTAGVIARASTIEANRKQVCSCSGKTLWQERAERSQRNASEPPLVQNMPTRK